MFRYIDSFDREAVLALNSFLLKYSYPVIDKIFAECLIYLLPIILIVLWFYSEKSKKVDLKAFFSAILAWPIIANILGRILDRPRPFESGQVEELIFHRPTYSFPSDHAAALFAVAFSFWFSGYKKLGGAIFAAGLVVSFFRVATGVHFPTDILGGLVIGLVAAYLIEIFDRPLDIVYKLIIRIFRILRLS